MGPIFRSRFIFIYLPFHSVLCLTFSKVIKWKFKKKFCGIPGTNALSNHLEISKISWDYSFKRVAEPHCPAAFDAAAGFATLLILIMPINHHSKELYRADNSNKFDTKKNMDPGFGFGWKKMYSVPKQFLGYKILTWERKKSSKRWCCFFFKNFWFLHTKI